MRVQRPRPRSSHENILPMINVVFLLLIFFMLAGAIETVDLYDIDPPTARSQAGVDRAEALLLVDRQGRLALDNTEIDLAALHEAISLRLAETPDLVVNLKADGRVATTRIVEIMERLQDSGLARLSLLTLETEG